MNLDIPLINELEVIEHLKIARCALQLKKIELEREIRGLESKIRFETRKLAENSYLNNLSIDNFYEEVGEEFNSELEMTRTRNTGIKFGDAK